MKEHEPDAAGRNASLPCRMPPLTTRVVHLTRWIFSFRSTSSAGTPLAEAVKVARAKKRSQRHGRLEPPRDARHSTQHVRVGCEEVRNIMLTRATLMNAAQPMDI